VFAEIKHFALSNTSGTHDAAPLDTGFIGSLDKIIVISPVPAGAKMLYCGKPPFGGKFKNLNRAAVLGQAVFEPSVTA
jgi:hypothetical protein